jgi:hypothetical protein
LRQVSLGLLLNLPTDIIAKPRVLQPPFDRYCELQDGPEVVVTEDTPYNHDTIHSAEQTSPTQHHPNGLLGPRRTSRSSINISINHSKFREHDLLDSLPTIFRDSDNNVFQVRDDVTGYLKRDFDVSRLNNIHNVLWMAGRPLNARPLHRQIMMDLRILRTEQADLHILRVSDRIFVKPLPAYILSYTFWEKYLCSSNNLEARALHKSVCGFLLSYVWLIVSELDLRIAHESQLLPRGVTWSWWKAFVASFLAHVDPNALDQVNIRYHYGELRLSRINSIYRIRYFHSHFIRGYLYGYNRYVVFFQRNFGWMLVIFVYFSLVLSAMQVGVSVPPLSESRVFQKASYGFVVFAIVLVAAVVGLVGVLFVCIFTINTILSIRHIRLKSVERMKRSKRRTEMETGKEA